jgi:hypothetical protein
VHMGVLRWLRGSDGTGTLASALGELDAFYNPARRKQLENLKSMELMRDDEASGAPPRAVDLETGTARIRLRRRPPG